MAPGKDAVAPQDRTRAQCGGSGFVDDHLGYLLVQANHALFRDFDRTIKEAGLGSLEWRALAALSDQPPMTVGRLARGVLGQQPTVTKLLQRLAASGWVRLDTDPQDQRRTLVSITAAGQRKIQPLIAQ